MAISHCNLTHQTLAVYMATACDDLYYLGAGDQQNTLFILVGMSSSLTQHINNSVQTRLDVEDNTLPFTYIKPNVSELQLLQSLLGGLEILFIVP